MHPAAGRRCRPYVWVVLCVALCAFSIFYPRNQTTMLGGDSDEEYSMPHAVVQACDGKQPLSRWGPYNSSTHGYFVESDDDDFVTAPCGVTGTNIGGACASHAPPVMHEVTSAGNPCTRGVAGDCRNDTYTAPGVCGSIGDDSVDPSVADVGGNSGTDFGGSSVSFGTCGSGSNGADGDLAGSERTSMFDAPPVIASGDGRGRYSRAGGKGRRTSWLKHVHQLATAANAGNLSAFKAVCSKGCPNQGGCFETTTTRIIKCCLEESFGAACLEMDASGQFAKPTEITPNHTAVRMWWDQAKMGRILDDNGKLSSLTYKVNDTSVCLNFWAKAYGIAPSTADTIDRKLKQGQAQWEQDGAAQAAALANRTLRGSLVNAAASWWMERIMMYETITTRGIILYPRGTIWKDVYAEEFIPDMKFLGFNWKMPAPHLTAAQVNAATHARLHARTHARLHARTHARMDWCLPLCRWIWSLKQRLRLRRTTQQRTSMLRLTVWARWPLSTTGNEQL